MQKQLVCRFRQSVELQIEQIECYNQNFIEDKIKCALFNLKPSWKNQNQVSNANNRCNGQSERNRKNESKSK